MMENNFWRIQNVQEINAPSHVRFRPGVKSDAGWVTLFGNLFRYLDDLLNGIGIDLDLHNSSSSQRIPS